MMRNAKTILDIIRKRGQLGLPVQDAYRLLYQQDLYLRAYGKIYRNKGATTKGVTPETVDGMSLEKIEMIIKLLRNEQYRWTPVRRTYIPKKNVKSKLRPLGLPSWSDKLLQEVIRSILEAYYEPKFCEHSHGFRPNRGCHTALREIIQKGTGTKWFIEGDLCACFDRIDHTTLLNILKESFHDNRFIRLLSGLFKAGYLENWKFNNTLSGVPQGSLVGPILSNVILDRLDNYVEKQIIPAYTKGSRRKPNPPYTRLIRQITEARRKNDWKRVHRLNRQAQSMPSYDPNDPSFQRLWYVRYADDFLLGLTGTKNEAMAIKQKISEFLSNDLKLELNAEKTLVTHARSQKAKFLGYEIHTIHDDSKHNRQGKRCVNGKIGLRIPQNVKQEKRAKYMKHRKPKHMPQQTINEAYDIVSQYQTEYRGIVEYYRMAYNLHTLNELKYVMGISLVKTLASKYKTTCSKVYKRYGTKIRTEEGERKVLLVKVERAVPKEPLIAYFGGISLKSNKWVSINENPAKPNWNRRCEVVQRLLAKECELCGSHENIEVHHVRKLADLKQKGRPTQPEWKKVMSAKRRKTLVVCRICHHDIHYGRYDGKKLSA